MGFLAKYEFHTYLILFSSVFQDETMIYLTLQ